MSETNPQEIVRKNILAFVEYAEALIAIRDQRLFRGNHSTFEDYIRAEFGENAEKALECIKEYESWGK